MNHITPNDDPVYGFFVAVVAPRLQDGLKEAEPNAAHKALVDLQELGKLQTVALMQGIMLGVVFATKVLQGCTGSEGIDVL